MSCLRVPLTSAGSRSSPFGVFGPKNSFTGVSPEFLVREAANLEEIRRGRYKNRDRRWSCFVILNLCLSPPQFSLRGLRLPFYAASALRAYVWPGAAHDATGVQPGVDIGAAEFPAARSGFCSRLEARRPATGVNVLPQRRQSDPRIGRHFGGGQNAVARRDLVFELGSASWDGPAVRS